MVRINKTILSALSFFCLGVGGAHAERILDGIKQSKELSACIKVDYRPFGYLSPDGQMIGLEHDLLENIRERLAKKLGVSITLKKIPVIAANRVQFLQQGKCDVLIATMTDNAARRKIINIVQPDYYSSGITVIARKSTPLKTWGDIKGKTLCVSQGAFWNKEYERRYNLHLLAFPGIAEAGKALIDGRCIGNLTDDSLAASRLLDKKTWGDFEIKLPVQDNAPWGIATQFGNPEFAKFLSATIADWHKTGYLVELEKKWDLPNTQYIKDMHEKYKNS